MSDKCNVFVNPEDLPVEKLTLSVNNDGVVQQFKALDPYWVEKRELTIYERPPSVTTVLGAVDAWIVRMETYLEDVKWLLSLEYHRFWSTVIYHPHCMDALVSFLQEASPPYLPPHENKSIQKLYGEIRRFVLIVFSRLITNKESKSQWMSKEYMGGVIYDKFIFTIPIVWDICLVYGVDNPQHVARVLDAVFSLQRRYEGDMAAAIGFVKEAFKYIILQVNKDYDSDGPPNLPDTFKGFSEIRRPSSSKKEDKFTFDMLRDLVIHLLDTALTLRIFVEAYTNSVHILKKTHFINSIVQLYEYGVPQLYEKLIEFDDETSTSSLEVERYIDMARVELIDVFREILAVYKNAIFSGEGDLAIHVEDYLSVMMDGLSEKLLVKDYNKSYPVNDDLEIIKQAYPGIDSVKTDFILQAIYSNLDEPIPESIPPNNSTMNGHITTIDNPQTDEVKAAKDNDIPQNIREDSLINEVKDILPHLGEGFILKCLQHYGFNSERVISSILEDNLDQSLRDLDQSLPIIPEDPLDKKFLETGIQRLNVFDGDEFDIMSRDDVDVKRIHVGKRKTQYKNLSDMLDDKSLLNNIKESYNKYSMVCDDASMYSDEYDDTYDSDGVVPNTDATDERRPFVTPRALLPRGGREEESEEESVQEEEEKEMPSGGRGHMDFCINPEVIRAKREANMRISRGKGNRPPPRRTTDVIGKPKGQGQEKEVLDNRDRKEKHKSSRANHNRRQGSQWKRSQGMMPS